MGERRGVYRILGGKNLTDRENTWKDPGVDGRIILK
jgi:hypothetical protein